MAVSIIIDIVIEIITIGIITGLFQTLIGIVDITIYEYLFYYYIMTSQIMIVLWLSYNSLTFMRNFKDDLHFLLQVLTVI